MDEMEIGPANSFDSKMHSCNMEDLTIVYSSSGGESKKHV
jgi:hypothetical protein